MTTGNATNWKNVNNWHWVEKNVFPWAKDYLTANLQGTSASDGDVTVSVDNVRSVTGDVDINQRKGKVLTIYDIAMTLEWKGEGFGTTASGKIELPEYMHDTDLDDLEYEITLDSSNSERDKIKAVVRAKLIPAIKEKLREFSKAVVDEHLKDVYIPPENMTGHPTLRPYQPKPPVAEKVSAPAQTKKAVLGGVTTIKQTVEFKATAQDIYITLLDAGRVSAWTRGPAQISPKADTDFSILGGNITGKLVTLTPNETIIQKWRLKSWPADHFSTVTMTFEQGSDATTLKVVQDNVPIGEKDITEENWKEYYWRPIKSTFGFGGLL
ncbi:hypothetical protein HDU85_005566 [Gaertneriomyces sp. JEL0708]|nr:hypothetical protein HDU85_005566 [Gaertneriomyces sp. JEL0708]